MTVHRPQIRDGRDYGSYLSQHAEWRELVGYAADPDERVQGAEDDLQQDLEQERRGVKPPLALRSPAASVVELFGEDNDGSAAGTGRAA